MWGRGHQHGKGLANRGRFCDILGTHTLGVDTGRLFHLDWPPVAGKVAGEWTRSQSDRPFLGQMHEGGVDRIGL